MMPAQFVKPYVKSQKNDATDAGAICEAVQRPTMRFVSAATKTRINLTTCDRLISAREDASEVTLEIVAPAITY